MKRILIFFLAICVTGSSFSQTGKVKGALSTTDTADLTILNIYPDSFPSVSVVFKAETRKGEPVWNLTREKMTVRENNKSCEVLSLEQVSKNKPINLGIVIDHSGSMAYDSDTYLGLNYDDVGNVIYPAGYMPPIEDAKTAVKKFVRSFDTRKDFISITGFSTTVDKRLPLTQDVSLMSKVVDSMQATESTALYDAILDNMNGIRQASGIKVLIVLTDGQDNASRNDAAAVISSAVKENIPVYIIGLGDVNKDTLQWIAQSTKGKFYFTSSSSSLITIYAEISKQVQAFYDLVYLSPSLSSADSSRQVELSFDTDSLYLVTTASDLKLPAEVISRIEKKERQKNMVLYGGILTAVLIAAGTILVRYRKKKKASLNKPEIRKIYPNPADQFIQVDVRGAGLLQVYSYEGQVVKTISAATGIVQVNTGDLKNGEYIAILRTADGQQSDAVKFLVSR